MCTTSFWPTYGSWDFGKTAFPCPLHLQQLFLALTDWHSARANPELSHRSKLNGFPISTRPVGRRCPFAAGLPAPVPRGPTTFEVGLGLGSVALSARQRPPASGARQLVEKILRTGA